MKFLLPSALLAVLFGSASNAIVASGIVDQTSELTDLEKAEFFAWTSQHGKFYQTEEEAQLRLSIWKKNDGTSCFFKQCVW